MGTTSIRDQLLHRRHELLARYHGTRERADQELAEREPEDVERAAEQWDARVLSALGDSDARALAAIVSALRRIESGSYGLCTVCGDSIGVARLEALPTATACIACARRGAGSAR
jgi:DnaK suppressor protein